MKASRKPVPKVIAGTIGAGTVAAAVAIFGVDISPGLAALIATVASAVLAYCKTA